MIDRLVKSSILYLFIFFFYVLAISKMSIPLTGDQKVYLSIALEMRERGEWIIPYLFGEANFLKPPFQYWATLMGWNIFGFGLMGALLPSVVALLGCTFLVNRIAKTEFSNNSLLPGLLFSGALGTMTYGTTAQMEIWIVLFYLWAWLELLERRLLCALILVGVMAWVKGPLYPVLWVVSAVFYLFLNKERTLVISKRFLFSLAAGVTVGLLWYALAARTHLQPMLNVFLLRENMQKMQTSQGSPQGLWGTYFYSLFPWIFFLLISFSQKTHRESIRQHKNFYLAFALIPALFFTFFPYRVNAYLYILTPVAAWMTTSNLSFSKNTFSKSISIVTTIVAAGLCALVLRLWMGQWVGYEIAVPFLMVLILWAYSHLKLNLTWVALSSLLMVNLVRVGAVELGEKDLEGLRAFRERNQGPIAYYVDIKDIWHEYGLVSSAIQTDIERLYDIQSVDAFMQARGAVIFSDAQLAETRGLICEDWPRLRKRIKFPIVRLLKEGLNYSDPDLMRSYRICQNPLN